MRSDSGGGICAAIYLSVDAKLLRAAYSALTWAGISRVARGTYSYLAGVFPTNMWIRQGRGRDEPRCGCPNPVSAISGPMHRDGQMADGWDSALHLPAFS